MKIKAKELINDCDELKEEYLGWYLDGVFKMEGVRSFGFNSMDTVGIMVECPDGRGDTLYRYDTDYVEISKEKK